MPFPPSFPPSTLSLLLSHSPPPSVSVFLCLFLSPSSSLFLCLSVIFSVFSPPDKCVPHIHVTTHTCTPHTYHTHVPHTCTTHVYHTHVPHTRVPHTRVLHTPTLNISVYYPMTPSELTSEVQGDPSLKWNRLGVWRPMCPTLMH